MPSSRGSSQSREQTCISCTVCGFFIICTTREALYLEKQLLLLAVPLASGLSLITEGRHSGQVFQTNLQERGEVEEWREILLLHIFSSCMLMAA